MQTGIDVENARNIEHIVMLEDAKMILERYQNGEKSELYLHPKSGATLLHIAAAKGYNDAMKYDICFSVEIRNAWMCFFS